MIKNNIVENLRKQIEKFKDEVKTEKVGHVVEVFDGIAKVSGLSDVKVSEMVNFSGGEVGVALNLEEEFVGIIILSDFSIISFETILILLPLNFRISYFFLSLEDNFSIKISARFLVQ